MMGGTESDMKDKLDFCRGRACIVGGKGRMGRWFERLFTWAGISTMVLDVQDARHSPEVIPFCDIVLLAVPIPAIESVLRTIGPLIRTDALLADISSIKKKPIDLMLQYSQSEVIGMHPLFGPGAESLSDQLIFLCPSRTEIWLSPLKEFLVGYGAEIKEIDPDQHDRLMACFQTLRHIMLTALGQTVVRMGYHSGAKTRLAGTWFNQLLSMLQCQSQQPPDLYTDIAIENPHSAEILIVFQEILFSLTNSITKHDRHSLIDAMSEANKCCLPLELLE